MNKGDSGSHRRSVRPGARCSVGTETESSSFRTMSSVSHLNILFLPKIKSFMFRGRIFKTTDRCLACQSHQDISKLYSSEIQKKFSFLKRNGNSAKQIIASFSQKTSRTSTNEPSEIGSIYLYTLHTYFL